MKTQAYFENIQIEITRQLNLARYSVIIAVAWFTDSELFNLLLELSSRGVNVQLLILNDEINNQSGIKYEELQTSGGKLWKVNNQVNLMHNKFCVIDEQIVI
jgi:phosphatidylserine/phosphatidylglycerophosphate/cardiolipin synthase-like enzyme